VRILPGVLQARDREETRRILFSWLEQIGDPAPCSPCAALPDSIQSKPRLGWIRIRDRSLLGLDLSDRLKKIYGNRPANPDDQRQRWNAFQFGSIDSAKARSHRISGDARRSRPYALARQTTTALR
jgi:hypothetical protein